MRDDDRHVLAERCRTCDESRIVITHGTDTMVETAGAIAGAVTGKTIVLTGAMVPYAFGSSDGLFNLGSALSFVQVLPPGVYVAMNGTHFAWDAVRKNRALVRISPETYLLSWAYRFAPGLFRRVAQVIYRRTP